ncbi:hypothetical protein [Streptomyces sp. NPDC017673]|uniref:hypothetical protein n=1 Tax=Streptomyces sp. NPDC017673 TaxID=3365005 RepID=UPI003792BCAD
MGQAADAFATAIAHTTDPHARAVLGDLHVLVLLSQVHSRSGLLLAEGALSRDHVSSTAPHSARSDRPVRSPSAGSRRRLLHPREAPVLPADADGHLT